jgi:tRNA-guanine family transglycosylase
VPERDCGESIVEKAHTVHEIRKLLDSGEKSPDSRMLHLLGCGDPLSMLLFVYAGASSFDSLDWLKYCADPDQLLLHNFSHLELLNCDCMVCARKDKQYIEKVFLHNLLFYQNYVLRIQELIKENSIGKLLEGYFSKTALDKVT